MSTGSSTTFFFTESFKCIKVKITKKKEGGRGAWVIPSTDCVKK